MLFFSNILLLLPRIWTAALPLKLFFGSVILFLPPTLLMIPRSTKISLSPSTWLLVLMVTMGRFDDLRMTGLGGLAANLIDHPFTVPAFARTKSFTTSFQVPFPDFPVLNLPRYPIGLKVPEYGAA